MPSLQELLDQKAALEKAIDVTRKQERTEAIAKVRALMSQYGLSVSDLSAKAATGKTPSAGKGGKVAVKYRNDATGDTWSGRGLQPKWLKAAIAAGRKVEDFAVK
jgi:DNA-binding protein H-NS